MARWILRMIRGGDQWRPGGVLHGRVVPIRISQRDCRDWPPEDESVLGVPARDARIGFCDIHRRQNARLLQEGKTVSLGNIDGRPIPETGGIARPENTEQGFVGGAHGAVGMAHDLDLLVVRRVLSASEGGRTWRQEVSRGIDYPRGRVSELRRGSGQETRRCAPPHSCFVCSKKW